MSMTYAIDYSTIDLSIVNGRLVKRDGPEEVRQRIWVTLNHFYGEYFLNLPGGVPWLELILGSRNVPLVNLLLRRIIGSVPGVISIMAFSSSFANRGLAVSAEVEVAQGYVAPVQFSSSNLIIDGGQFGVDSQFPFDGGAF